MDVDVAGDGCGIRIRIRGERIKQIRTWGGVGLQTDNKKI